MVDLSRRELEKLAKISGLSFSEQEAEALRSDLIKFLEYSWQIMQVSSGVESESFRNVNVFREDKVYAQDSAKLTAVFQKKKDGFLVVPKVLD